MRRSYALLIILWLCLAASAATPTAALPALQPGSLELLRRTEHFDLYLAPGSLTAVEALELSERLEPTLLAISRRFGSEFAARERIELLPPQQGDCAIRGITFSSQRLIQLFYGPGADLDRLQALVAHELVHQLQRERFGDSRHQAADIILLEGWATVASDGFARTPDGAEPRWRARLREVVRSAEILPLTTDLERDCRTTTRNAIYDQWASFVSFLEQRYGRSALVEVYGSGSGRAAGSADYLGVYGKGFAELEAEWRAWVLRQFEERPIRLLRRAIPI